MMEQLFTAKHEIIEFNFTQRFCLIQVLDFLLYMDFFIFQQFMMSLPSMLRDKVKFSNNTMNSIFQIPIKRFNFVFQENLDLSVGQFSASNTLGVEVCKVHRRFSGNLQLPPLSWRQAEKERDRGRPLTPEEDPMTRTRPTSLPIASLPRIDITQADPDR